MGYLSVTEEDMNIQRTLLYVYKKALETLPEGRLHCKRKNHTLQYYRWDKKHKKQIYIPQKNHKLVFELKYRRMLEEAIVTIEQNLKVQGKILRQYKSYHPAALMSRLGEVYQDMPELLYHPELQDPNKDGRENYQLKKWENERNQPTTFGMNFRTKSEAIIAELIHVAKIPFLSEAKLLLKDEFGRTKVKYPDFTFFPPGRGVLYWEHFGRMDSQQYRDDNFEKLSLYHYNDILPPDNLIITMERKDGSLDIAGINRIITGILMPLFYDAKGNPLF